MQKIKILQLSNGQLSRRVMLHYQDDNEIISEDFNVLGYALLEIETQRDIYQVIEPFYFDEGEKVIYTPSSNLSTNLIDWELH